MGTFTKFIESEAFFPVLILLLVLLMFLFASILMSGKKNQRKRIQERKNIKIDESAQVQLVQEHEMSIREKEEEKLEIETGSTEVNLLLEDDQIESVDISEVEPLEVSNKNEEVAQVQPNVVIEPTNVRTPETIPAAMPETMPNAINVDLSDTEVEVAPFVIKEENTSDQYNIPVPEVVTENPNLDQTVNVELTKPLDKSNDIGEEIDIPHPIMKDESKEIPVIDDNKPQTNNDAFEIKPNGNVDINENIQVEKPKEYISDKTEVLEFPDFDSLNQDTDIEEKIIAAANKYIESIMNR